ncbi:MAG: intracellular septation protein A [Rhodobacterales bacterium 12-64-8]|nr:MAG: intracellular septation protein A [Rhodobacterales bacterium 12-64-8]OYX45947.1 MAG: intracellular septation protein A [Alphaproteobacteria bacterium 32-64-14]
MSDAAPTEPKKSIPKGAGNIWTDLAPVLVFVISFNAMQNFAPETGPVSKETAIFWATGLFMGAVAVAIGWTLMRGRKLPPMLIITGMVVMVFGGLTLFLQDKTFAFIKPTIINLLFAVTILGSLAIGRNLWKTAFEHAFTMTDQAWKIFALRWAAFYVVLAIVNEIIWRNFSEAFWTNSKLFLSIPLAIAFMVINLPFLMKHNIEDGESGGEKKAGDPA